MPLKLISPGGGSVTLDVPSMSNTYTFMLPTANSGAILTTSVYPAEPGTSGNVVTSNGTAFTSQSFNSLLDTALPNVSVSRITSGTANSSFGSISYVDFTGIPSWVKRVTVMVAGLSINLSGLNNYDFLLQLGTSSGGIATTDYNAGGSEGGAGAGYTNGFGLPTGPYGATVTYSGLITICNLSGNTWVAQGGVSNSGGVSATTSGSKALSATLDRVRITTKTGVATFDAGSINILYE